LLVDGPAERYCVRRHLLEPASLPPTRRPKLPSSRLQLMLHPHPPLRTGIKARVGVLGDWRVVCRKPLDAQQAPKAKRRRDQAWPACGSGGPYCPVWSPSARSISRRRATATFAITRLRSGYRRSIGDCGVQH